jgi:phage anti-repressor protein
MNELIVIQSKQIGNEEINSVDARDLHSRLGLKSDFSTWAKQNIKKLNLVENVDYTTIHNKVDRQISVEYVLSLDTGKHIAMMTNTETAHEVRTYFIDFEKKAKTALTSYGNDPFIMLRMHQIETEKRVDLLENKIESITPSLSSNTMFRITGTISSIAKLYRRMQEVKRVCMTHAAAQGYITSITLEKFGVNDIAYLKDVNAVTRYLQGIGKTYQAEYDKWFNANNLFGKEAA